MQSYQRCTTSGGKMHNPGIHRNNQSSFCKNLNHIAQRVFSSYIFNRNTNLPKKLRRVLCRLRIHIRTAQQNADMIHLIEPFSQLNPAFL